MRSQPKTMAGEILVFLRPPLRLFGVVSKILYRVLFSWWLTPLIEHHFEKAFGNEIQQAAPFLFACQGAKVVSNPRPQARDPGLSEVFVASGNLFLKFSQWRAESYEVRVSPTFAPNDSYDLIDALYVVNSARRAELSSDIRNWHHFARLLEPRFEQMQTAFNQENFEDTKLKLALLRAGKLPV